MELDDPDCVRVVATEADRLAMLADVAAHPEPPVIADEHVALLAVALIRSQQEYN